MNNIFKSFPFQPYEIQKNFMACLYKTISEKGIGIIESPTGTGKSLSIICGSFSWLVQEKQEKMQIESDDDEVNLGELPDWVDEVYSKQKKKLKRERSENKNDFFQPQSICQPKKKRKMENKTIKQKRIVQNLLSMEEQTRSNDEEFLLGNSSNITKNSSFSCILNDLYSEDKLMFNQSEFETPKIIYCTRTHSQINQFVNEIKKTSLSRKLSIISLISRKFFCINSIMRKKYPFLKILNEKCIEKKSKECEFYFKKNFNLYTENLCGKVRDIEEIVNFGQKLQICPYYSVRNCVNEADVILMPYSSLINENTRKALGLNSLNDCVVIIDEAHNLIDSIVSVNSVELSLKKIKISLKQLAKYFERYKNRLKKENSRKLLQFIGVLKNLFIFLSKQNSSFSLKLNQFLIKTNLDSVNLYDIENFIIELRLAQKLNGFIEKFTENPDEQRNVIYQVKSFILSLMALESECKIFVKVTSDSKIIKFLLLNPSIYFKSIVEEAKSIILTGGTMEPISTLIKQVFPFKECKNRIRVFQFDHIIPKTNLFSNIISSFSESEFEFTFNNRNNPKMMISLGKLIVQLSKIVPDGIVCFFSSYKYENEVYEFFLKNGILKDIEKNKKYLREPIDSKNVNKVLNEYKKNINNNFPKNGYYFKGSLLSCVVGGKMSEGINFSDGYCRCVVVVGMPFPNIMDVELKEKMDFHDKNFGSGEGRKLYLDLCMVKVNQSIGRAIRHQNDYSGILLVDKRYRRNVVIDKIPKWIRKSLIVDETNVLERLSGFFVTKEKNQKLIQDNRKRSSNK